MNGEAQQPNNGPLEPNAVAEGHEGDRVEGLGDPGLGRREEAVVNQAALEADLLGVAELGRRGDGARGEEGAVMEEQERVRRDQVSQTASRLESVRKEVKELGDFMDRLRVPELKDKAEELKTRLEAVERRVGEMELKSGDGEELKRQVEATS